MTPTLRKLYHRRGKLLSYLNEIDRQIDELTPQKGDLVVFQHTETDFYIGVYCSDYIDSYIYLGNNLYIKKTLCKNLTILEKGFER